MDTKLFNAILAMDSYNRGYGQSIFLGQLDGNGNFIPNSDISNVSIGNTAIEFDSNILKDINGNRLDQKSDFYAVAYDVNGIGTIISYRGTDNLLADGKTGYGVATGIPDVDQGVLAFGFYQTVANGVDPKLVSIQVTGHSLGGGLAGLVGAIYGKTGDLFDNMPFELAANNTALSAIINSSFGDLVYGASDPWAPTISSSPDSLLQSYSLDGEFLSWLRSIQQTPETRYSLGTNVNLPGFDSGIAGGGLHSMSTLVIRMFFEQEDIANQGASQWLPVASYLWPALYDPDFSQQIGMDKIPGTSNTKGEYDGILRGLIAYSVIDSGTFVFGNSGIRALYDDANDFGKALNNASEGNAINVHATAISKIFVQFAGILALNKIEKSNGFISLFQNVTDGALTFNSYVTDPASGSFEVSFAENLWKAAGAEKLSEIVARDELIDGLIAGSGDGARVRSLVKDVWGGSTNEVFARAVFALEQFANTIVEDRSVPDWQATLVQGITGNDQIKGSGGNDLILGGTGNDKILTTGSGTDIVYGGAHNDTFFADFGGDYFDGGADFDTIDYIIQDQAEKLASPLDLGIKIKADLANGVVERELISGGDKSIDYINDIEGVIGASGDDTFKGKEGLKNQSFTGGLQTTERGDKVDFSDFIATNGGVTVNLGTGNGTDSENGTYTFSEIEQVVGTNKQDTITGDGHENWLFGNGGIDAISGGGGDDRIIGGGGSDNLEGGSGNDTFYISANALHPLWKQTGIDTITDGGGAADTIYLLGGYQFDPDLFGLSDSSLFIQNAATVTNATDIEQIEYSDGAKFSQDRLAAKEELATGGTVDNSVLEGDEDNNSLTGGGLITEVLGKGGNDWLYSTGNTVTLDGGEGEDYLFGPGILDGGGGNDYLDGQGNDEVIYKASSGVDVILDIGIKGKLDVVGSYSLWKADNGSLVIDLSNSSDPEGVINSTNKVIVLNHFTGNPLEFIGNDAVPTTGVKLLPTELDDVLTGTSGNDSFSASRGEDILNGDTGANTYTFTPTDTGSSTITSVPDSFTDTLIFSGLTQNDVSVVRDASIGTNNLLFSYAKSFTVLSDALIDETTANHYNVQFGNNAPVTFASLDLTTRGSYKDDTLIGDVPGFSIDGIIYGGAGNDDIDGRTGNDLLFGEEGDDVISGGDGEDTIDGGAGNDTVDSGNGSDLIIDNAGDDIYKVGKGDRVILGSGQNSVEFGGYQASAGDPATVYTVELPQNIDFGDTFLWRDAEGTITLDYGAHSVALAAFIKPVIDFTNDPDLTPDQMTLTTFGDGSDENIIDAFYGYFDSSGGFHISGQQNDIIYANGGNDEVVVTGGVDIVHGGDGNDKIGVQINPQNEFPTTGYVQFYGEAGDDLLGISDFSGELYGGAGNDELIGGGGNDILDGGDGDDWISTQGGDDTVTGGDGNDTILPALDGMVTVDGGLGNDLILVNIDNDDTLDGGEGNDIVSFEDFLSFLGITEINLSDQKAISDGEEYVFFNMEGAIGSKGDDLILGSSEDNVLDGGAGFGGFLAGNDTLKGESGNDTYFFGTSSDPRLPPSADASDNSTPPVIGDDIVDDASGSSDSIEFSNYFSLSDLSFNMSGNDLVISFAEGSVTIINHDGSGKIENLVLADGSILDLDQYDNWIIGTDGSDTLVGNAANQTLYGMGGDDTLTAHSGGSSLHGGAGIDTLTGSSGNDVLNGGIGNDNTSGGAGDDIYIFSPGDGFDVITETSGFDILSIFGGITLSDLTFAQVGDDLQIDIASGVTIKNFYSGNVGALIEEIHFEDGTIFDLTTLLNTTSNTDPVAQNDSFTGDQDVNISGNVLADNGNGVDSDPDGDPLNIVAGTFTTTHGSVLLATNGDFTYTPDAGYFGTDSFTYTLEDDQGGSTTGTVDILLNKVVINTDPIAQNDSFIGDQNVNIFGNVLVDNGNGVDSDPDGDPLNIVAGTFTTTHGSVLLAANGDFTYTPDAGYFGTDSFTYTLEDDQGGSATGTVDILLNEVTTNNPPVAQPDAFAMNEDSSLLANVLNDNGNGADFDSDGDILNVQPLALTTAAGASVTLLSNGDLTFTPLQNFNGVDSFTYTLLDPSGESDTAIVTITVNPVNDAPQAQDDSFVTDEDTVLSGNVLADNGNGADSDVEGDALSVQPAVLSTPAGASVLVNADGTFDYTPFENFNGSDSFNYTLLDIHGAVDTGTVSIEVIPVNDAPIAFDDNFTGNMDQPVIGNVLDNDTDVDLHPLNTVAANFTTSQGGLVNILEDGTFTYTPASGFFGTDSFDYTTTDNQGGSDNASVNITIDAAFNEIIGTQGRDNLIGTSGMDVMRTLAGSVDRMTGGQGADIFVVGLEAMNGIRERDIILDYEVGVDSILLEDGVTVGAIRQTSSGVAVFLEGDLDAIYVQGDGVLVGNLTFAPENILMG